MTNQNAPNFFSELDIGIIKGQFLEIAGKYNKAGKLIKRIILYKAGNVFQIGIKYVVILEIFPGEWKIPPKEKNGQLAIQIREDGKDGEAEWVPLHKQHIEMFLNYITEWTNKALDKKTIKEPYVEFFRNMIRVDNGSAFLDESECSKFYFDDPPAQFRDEWQLEAKESGTENDFHVILGSEKILFSYDDANDSRKQQSKKKLRPSNRHKQEVRKIADEIWKKNPNITIADMILLNEITDVFKDRVYKGQHADYSEKVLRQWVKDLCPNRNPGRRPKKNKSL